MLDMFSQEFKEFIKKQKFIQKNNNFKNEDFSFSVVYNEEFEGYILTLKMKLWLNYRLVDEMLYQVAHKYQNRVYFGDTLNILSSDYYNTSKYLIFIKEVENVEKCVQEMYQINDDGLNRRI